METATRSNLRTIAGQLAVIVGGVHLGLGAYYTLGRGAASGDPRVLVWSVAGSVLLLGTALVLAGWEHDHLHAVGAALVGLLLGGHLLWPVLAQGSLYLGAHPPVGLGDPLGYVHAQLFRARPIAKVLLALEVLLLALLVVLATDDGPA